MWMENKEKLAIKQENIKPLLLNVLITQYCLVEKHLDVFVDFRCIC